MLANLSLSPRIKVYISSLGRIPGVKVVKNKFSKATIYYASIKIDGSPTIILQGQSSPRLLAVVS